MVKSKTIRNVVLFLIALICTDFLKKSFGLSGLNGVSGILLILFIAGLMVGIISVLIDYVVETMNKSRVISGK